MLERAEVPGGKIYSIADIAARPALRGARHDRAPQAAAIASWCCRGSCRSCRLRPGDTRWIGPRLGEHTDEVLGSLGLDAAEIAALRGRGAVA